MALPLTLDFNFKNRPTVLVTDSDVQEAGMNILRRNCNVIISQSSTREEILKLSRGVDGILWTTFTPLDADALDAAGPNLKSISVLSAGYDYVDLPEVRRRKIPIGYTPLIDDAVADIAVGLLIAAARRFQEARWKIENSEWVFNHHWLLGQDTKGSMVGIVGFGNIGQTIAKRLQGFEVGKILYSGHNAKPEAAKFNAEFVPFNELLAKSDFVVIATPLIDETRNLFNATTFAQMKPTSVLINIARGQIVNTDDLVTALKTGQIFAAGLDVMDPEPLPSDHELLKLANLVLTPHLGSATTQTRNNIAILAAQNILLGIAGQPMLTSVP